jgi:transcriptional regulator with XRE-family HTH domain
MTDPKFLAQIGQRIRELRLKAGMTQNELAIHCNFEKASMSRIESGKSNITVLTLRKIGKALNVEIVEFFRH